MLSKTRSKFFVGCVFGICVLILYSVLLNTKVSMPALLGLKQKGTHVADLVNQPMDILNVKYSSADYSQREKRNSMDMAARERKASDGHYLICPEPNDGRLGNHMFQFAAAFGIAKALNYTFIVDSSFYFFRYFEIRKTPQIKVENVLELKEAAWRYIRRSGNKSYLSYNLTLSLESYYQAETHFKNVSDQIWQSFAIKRYYLDRAREFLALNVPEMRTRVCVHVRRGDFLSPGSIAAGRVVADRGFMNKSINFFRRTYSDAFFIVLSEDKDWCNNNIFGDDYIFTDFNLAILDLAVMSLCEHAIITVGTFGWWGGWLSGGTVIYLKDFPRPGSEIASPPLFIREEYYPSHWIAIGNSNETNSSLCLESDIKNSVVILTIFFICLEYDGACVL